MSQNPVADIISIPFEFWRPDGPNGDGFMAIVKPVISTSVGTDWSVLLGIKFILPK